MSAKITESVALVHDFDIHHDPEPQKVTTADRTIYFFFEKTDDSMCYLAEKLPPRREVAETRTVKRQEEEMTDDVKTTTICFDIVSQTMWCYDDN